MRHGSTVQVDRTSSVDSNILSEGYTVYDIVMNPKEAEAILSKELQSDTIKTEVSVLFYQLELLSLVAIYRFASKLLFAFRH